MVLFLKRSGIIYYTQDIVNHPQAEDLWACHEQLSP